MSIFKYLAERYWHVLGEGSGGRRFFEYIIANHELVDKTKKMQRPSAHHHQEHSHDCGVQKPARSYQRQNRNRHEFGEV